MVSIRATCRPKKSSHRLAVVANVDYCQHSLSVDSVEVLTHLEKIQNFSLLICERGRDPKDSATNPTPLLSFLRTSADLVLTSDNLFIIPLLQSEMVLGEDHQVVDGVIKVSHYGRRKIGLDCTTAEHESRQRSPRRDVSQHGRADGRGPGQPLSHAVERPLEEPRIPPR
jgi:hypothetical protein